MSPTGVPAHRPATPPARSGPVAISGLAAVSAFGRGTGPLLAAALAGGSAFRPVDRFDVSRRRVRVAATMPGTPTLLDELIAVVTEACATAGLDATQRAGCGLMLAVHGDPDLPRAPLAERSRHTAAALAGAVAGRAGLGAARRTYTSACTAASTAVADAAATICHGLAERVVVAAGYLVEPDQFALFDAGRALATDGQVRPFSTERSGLLLGDGVAAIVVESAATARARGARPIGWLAGWGRAGDAYHVCQPHPDGRGLARAITAALRRAGVPPTEVGYVNAHGSGTPRSDVAEAAGLRTALGAAADRTPVSSTKSVHGQALEASGLVELVVTMLALNRSRLPVNAGFLGADEECPLDIVVEPDRQPATPYALSVNSAFGGANTALLVRAA